MIQFRPLRGRRVRGWWWALSTDSYTTAMCLSELLRERQLRYMPLYWMQEDARELLDALEYAQS